VPRVLECVSACRVGVWLVLLVTLPGDVWYWHQYEAWLTTLCDQRMILNPCTLTALVPLLALLL
jgi:hypothetical protein